MLQSRDDGDTPRGIAGREARAKGKKRTKARDTAKARAR